MKGYLDTIRELLIKDEQDLDQVSRVLERLYLGAAKSWFGSSVKRSEEFRIAQDVISLRTLTRPRPNGSLDEIPSNPFRNIKPHSEFFAEHEFLKELRASSEAEPYKISRFVNEVIAPNEFYVPAVLIADILECERHKERNAKVANVLLAFGLALLSSCLGIVAGLLTALITLIGTLGAVVIREILERKITL